MTADIISNSNSETIKGIGELLNTDVNYNTILTLLKNLQRVGGLMKPTDVATTANMWNSIQCLIDGFNDNVTTFNPSGTTLASG